MNADIEHAREDIRDTQQQIGRTITEIEGQISETASEVAHRANPLTYAREYPWIALGLALGAGLALALTGADAAAAGAVIASAKKASASAGDGAAAVKEKVVDLAHHSAAEPADQAEAAARVPATGHDLSGGLKDTSIARAITGLLSEGLDEVLTGLGRQRPSAERRLAGF